MSNADVTPHPERLTATEYLTRLSGSGCARQDVDAETLSAERDLLAGDPAFTSEEWRRASEPYTIPERFTAAEYFARRANADCAGGSAEGAEHIRRRLLMAYQPAFTEDEWNRAYEE